MTYSMLTTTATILLSCLLMSRVAAEPRDHREVRAETSRRSRWYQLSELGIRNPPAAVSLEPLDSAHLHNNDENSGFLNLADHSCPPPLELLWDRQVLVNSEAWESGIETGRDVAGYPSVVHNVNGAAQDGKYYLYYAIHDSYSGIAVAIADSLDGKFHKLRELEPRRADSRVLRAPELPRNASHFSSPVVLWNPQEKRWFMYFHYYSNEWDRGFGHQRTALAVTNDLASHVWTPWTDSSGRLIAVLPTTRARWMDSQSTYHSIQRLPNGTWLAFLRGVGGEYVAGQWKQDPAKLGFAVSLDGRRWAEVPGNPLIHQLDGRHGLQGVYRPQFIATLSDRFLLAWSESEYYDSDPRLVFGTTRDFRSIQPVSIAVPTWRPADGAVSSWRDSDTIYFFYGSRQSAWRMLNGCAGQLNSSAP